MFICLSPFRWGKQVEGFTTPAEAKKKACNPNWDVFCQQDEIGTDLGSGVFLTWISTWFIAH
jgi:hypothetical protein